MYSLVHSIVQRFDAFPLCGQTRLRTAPPAEAAKASSSMGSQGRKNSKDVPKPWPQTFGKPLDFAAVDYLKLPIERGETID